MRRFFLSSPFRFIHVWRRNQLVWQKLALPSILGNLADPLLYMLGLGYGLGKVLPSINGNSYLVFLAGGVICSSTMMSASFESMYSAFSRMQIQRTWEAIINTPVDLNDVILGELTWAASKSLLSGAAVLLVAALLGATQSPLCLLILPLIALTGLVFAGLGLMITAWAPNYDFFMYYFTLAITPMMMMCGVFFPVDQLPLPVQTFAQLLPLTHAVAMTRPLLDGQWPSHALLHVLVLCGYAGVSYALCRRWLQQRLLK